MKTVSDDLFQLIRAMTRSEKRYFKLQTQHSKEEGSNHIRLFDAINALEEYDEEELRRSLAGEPFLEYLPVAKSQLQKLILRNLRLFHSGMNGQFEARECIEQATILYNKHLFQQARKLLERARRIAVPGEMFTELIDICRLESMMNSYEGAPYHGELFDQVRDALAREENAWKLGELKIRMFDLFRSLGTVRDPRDLERTRELLEHPLCRDESEALSRRARLAWHDIHRIHQLITGATPDAYRLSKRHLEAVESDFPGGISHDAYYMTVLYTHLINSLSEKRFEEAEEVYGKVAALHPVSEADKRRWIDVKYVCLFEFLLAKKDFARMVEVEVEFLAGPGRARSGKGEVASGQVIMVVTFWMAIAFFELGEYSSSLDRLGRVLDNPDRALRDDVRWNSRMMQLIVHYELGNLDLLAYLVRSAARAMAKREQTCRADALLLDYLRRLLRAAAPRDIADIFSELRRDLLALGDDPQEASAMENTRLRTWVERHCGVEIPA